jgi:hypothetical protein
MFLFFSCIGLLYDTAFYRVSTMTTAGRPRVRLTRDEVNTIIDLKIKEKKKIDEGAFEETKAEYRIQKPYGKRQKRPVKVDRYHVDGNRLLYKESEDQVTTLIVAPVLNEREDTRNDMMYSTIFDIVKNQPAEDINSNYIFQEVSKAYFFWGQRERVVKLIIEARRHLDEIDSERQQLMVAPPPPPPTNSSASAAAEEASTIYPSATATIPVEEQRENPSTTPTSVKQPQIAAAEVLASLAMAPTNKSTMARAAVAAGTGTATIPIQQQRSSPYHLMTPALTKPLPNMQRKELEVYFNKLMSHFDEKQKEDAEKQKKTNDFFGNALFSMAEQTVKIDKKNESLFEELGGATRAGFQEACRVVSELATNTKGQVNRLDRRIDDLGEGMTATITQLATNTKGQVNRLDGRIDDLGEGMTAAITQLATKTNGQVNRLDGRVDGVEEDLNGANEKLENHRTDCTQKFQEHSEKQKKLNCEVVRLKEKADGTKENLEGLRGELKTHRENSTREMNEIKENVTNLILAMSSGAEVNLENFTLVPQALLGDAWEEARKRIETGKKQLPPTILFGSKSVEAKNPKSPDSKPSAGQPVTPLSLRPSKSSASITPGPASQKAVVPSSARKTVRFKTTAIRLKDIILQVSSGAATKFVDATQSVDATRTPTSKKGLAPGKTPGRDMKFLCSKYVKKDSKDINRMLWKFEILPDPTEWAAYKDISRDKLASVGKLVKILEGLPLYDGIVFRAMESKLYEESLEKLVSTATQFNAAFVKYMVTLQLHDSDKEAQRKAVDSFIAKNSDLVKSSLFTEKGFCSTSQDHFDKQRTNNFQNLPIRFIIAHTSGRDISAAVARYAKDFDAEKETLFAPATQFIICDYEKENDKHVFYMKEYKSSPWYDYTDVNV